LFSLPGGKLKEDESISEGAVREIQEELGILIKDPQPLGHIELLDPGHAIVFVYTGNTNSNIAMQLNPKEVLEIKWVTLDMMSELGELPPNHEQVAGMIFKHLGTKGPS
jgi:8-oxo-dGTP diphosphatase